MAPLARTPSLLGWPHSWFLYLMLTVRPALATSVTLGVFPTLTPFAALAMHPAFAARPDLTTCPVQFPLPMFLASGLRMSPFMIFVPSQLGVFHDGGIIGIGLWRGPSPFVLFTIERGGLSFGYCLVKMLLALMVANGSGIGATDCTGMLPAALACFA